MIFTGLAYVLPACGSIKLYATVFLYCEFLERDYRLGFV